MLTVANDYIKFSVMAVGAALASISAFVALLGMYQIRRRPGRWPRGWKRAVWVFWLDVIYLLTFAAFYYLATHPDAFDKVLRAVQ